MADMLSDDVRREVADALVAAERDQRPIPPLRDTWPDLDVVDAYLETSTANPGALRFVREGRAEVARALAAQEYDSQH